MSEDSPETEFSVIRERELDEIEKRRREAGIGAESEKEGSEKPASENLVGLALSGGGVRSASFNLGFLQSLYQTGALRHIDYMSTVSGGGYVGSSLSSLALHPETEFDWKKRVPNNNHSDGSDETDNDEALFPLSPKKDGRQPPRVLELIHGGQYLRKPLIFLNRYLVGVLLTNIVALSLVFAIASIAAWMFRYLDHTWTINWLYALGFQGDIARAFFPAFLFFILWLVMWAISYWRRGAQAEGRVARWFMTLTIVSLLLACAALLGTGDVSLTHLRDNYGIEPPSELVRLVGGEFRTYFIIGLAIALIPYLRIKDLIRSGTRPSTAIEGWIFAIASRALLYGIPLLIFGWLARENISLFNENRTVVRHGQVFNTNYDFVPLDFRDWSTTWQDVELQATELSEQEGNGRFSVSRRVWNSVDQDAVHRSREVLRQIGDFDREVNMPRRWLMYLGYVITRQRNPVTDQFHRREEYLALRRKICDQLTRDVLVDPTLYKEFEHANYAIAIQTKHSDGEKETLRSEAIRSLCVEAQHLEKRIDDVTEDGLGFSDWLSNRQQILDKLDLAEAGGVTENQVALQQQFADLVHYADGEYARLESEIKSLNWQLMQNYWGEQRLSPKSTVYAMVCLAADQRTRWHWFLWSIGIFLITACCVNMNSTSLHGFYRNMLSKMWIVECPGLGRNIPLARLETVARGAPYHVISATVHLLGRRRKTDRATTDSFMFSQSFCGSERTGFVPTENYMNGKFDLSNAMALSGAAVSPTQVRNPLLAVLLMLSNSRLGQWLPNPGHERLISGWSTRVLSWLAPVPLRLILGAMQNAENRNYCFVSDGGHHENLGLEPLLRRRCRLIIASDVTSDGDYEFQDFIRLLRRMRFEHGIRIVGMNGRGCTLALQDLTPQRLQPDHCADVQTEALLQRLAETNLAESHYIIARIKYPDDEHGKSPSEGFLVYVKPNFTGDEAVDLTRYQLEATSFPHDPTTDQFYDPQKFESYRQLGYHIGNTLFHQQFKLDNHCAQLRHWQPLEGYDESEHDNGDDNMEAETASDKSDGQSRDGDNPPRTRSPR